MIYPDLAALLSLLVPGENSREISELVRDPRHHPFSLSIVHRLQVENALLRYLFGSDPAMKEAANDGLLLWRRYVEEGVFEIRSFALEEAFAQACAWNAASTRQPPRWHLLVHVALALSGNAAFLSLDPLLRKRASDVGLIVIPERL